VDDVLSCQRAKSHCCYQTANARVIMLAALGTFGQGENGGFPIFSSDGKSRSQAELERITLSDFLFFHAPKLLRYLIFYFLLNRSKFNKSKRIRRRLGKYFAIAGISR
jgi:hypothetical protein